MSPTPTVRDTGSYASRQEPTRTKRPRPGRALRLDDRPADPVVSVRCHRGFEYCKALREAHQMPQAAKLAAFLLNLHFDKDGGWSITEDELALEMSAADRKTAARAVTWLEAWGWIHVTRHANRANRFHRALPKVVADSIGTSQTGHTVASEAPQPEHASTPAASSSSWRAGVRALDPKTEEAGREMLRAMERHMSDRDRDRFRDDFHTMERRDELVAAVAELQRGGYSTEAFVAEHIGVASAQHPMRALYSKLVKDQRGRPEASAGRPVEPHPLVAAAVAKANLGVLPGERVA